MERRPFVEDALVRGENDPTILPPFVKPAELRKDLALYGDISEVYVVVEALFTRVSDLLHARIAISLVNKMNGIIINF